MMTFLLGFVTALGCVYVVFHFLPKNAKGQPELPTTLDAFGQILTHGEQAVIKRFDDFEASLQPTYERIFKMISDALNELKAAADAKEAKAVADAVAAATAPAVAQQQAVDEQVVRDFTAANFPPT